MGKGLNMGKKKDIRPYLTVAAGIIGILAREGIADIHTVVHTDPTKWITLVETELAEYFANKEFKALNLEFGTKEYKNQFKKIYKKHGINV